jgi:hypothetical protein
MAYLAYWTIIVLLWFIGYFKKPNPHRVLKKRFVGTLGESNQHRASVGLPLGLPIGWRVGSSGSSPLASLL